ncbi:MAG TPA: FecR domain-containing protein [Thermoanaerobaculia bacterium]|nr:FecR domain-containing protein [Thermoanaerobaculia bacterium]
MAKRKQTAAADIDWYLISIDRLKQIGLVVLILLLAGAGYWFWHKQQGNPRSTAEDAIVDAKQSLNALAASKEFNQHQSEFKRAQTKWDEANSLFAGAKYAEAQAAAVESHTISRTALSGGDRENDAQFLTVEGDVQYQKGSSGGFRDADIRTPLFNGDWVKTGERASAELMFSNGSLYTIGPNALLEIYVELNPATGKKMNSVQVTVGPVEVATTEDSSTVKTPGTQVIIESESSTQVGVDRTAGTSVVTTKGTASIAPESGGAKVVVASGTRVRATPQGEIGELKKLAMPPALLAPLDNQVFQLTPDLRVDFGWENIANASYVLQVSRSRLFTTLEINSRRQKTSAAAKVTSEGAFYWRVATIGADGEIGPYSSFRRFRIAGGAKAASDDHTPPRLTLKPAFHLGGAFFNIGGSTEPGATVFINNEEADVKSDGSFEKLVTFNKVGRNAVVIKAIDPAGNQTVQSQTVIIQEE